MKTRNEILECKANDRFIFIQYDEYEEVLWLNFHQGLDNFCDSFNKPCERLTTIYKCLTKGHDEKERYLFEEDLNRAIDLYANVIIFPKLKHDSIKFQTTTVSLTDEFATMLEWCLAGVVRLHLGDKVEMDEAACEELRILLEDEKEMESIRAYFNVLMYANDDNVMIGWSDTDNMFSKTLERYPAICRVLKVYVYA